MIFTARAGSTAAFIARVSATMNFARLPLALMLAAAPLPAFAQAAETQMADMKCMMAAGSIDPASPKEQQDAMMLMAVFYVGKVYGRNPAFDVSAFVTQNKTELEAIDVGTELKRCTAEFGQRGEALSKLGG
ncbi:MAG TPA: hypothetical protein PKA59_10900 [Chakrabartia sp.]|nr:hypothetical protein [Chakrabartia sp.]